MLTFVLNANDFNHIVLYYKIISKLSFMYNEISTYWDNDKILLLLNTDHLQHAEDYIRSCTLQFKRLTLFGGFINQYLIEETSIKMNIQTLSW